MRKVLLVVFIGMVLALNVYGISMKIYDKYFAPEDTVENFIEVIYVE